jgi:hypothetical protein
MVNISYQQARERWDTLPESLREALSSETNTDFFWRIIDSEHLTKEKGGVIARLMGHVLLGFIHPGDLALEIKEATQLNQQTADSIANAVNDRIFEPLKDELGRIYEPPSSLENLRSIKIEEIKKPRETVIEKIFGEKAEPSIGLDKIPTPPPVTERKLPEIPMQKNIQFPPASAQSKTGGGPPPTIIHREESGAKPLQPATDFKLDIPLPKLSETKINKETQPLKPATLEIGGREEKSQAGSVGSPQAPRPPEPPRPPRVVHYTELKTPLQKPDAAKALGIIPPPSIPTPPKPSPTETKLHNAGREIVEITTPPRDQNKPSSPIIPPPIPTQNKTDNAKPTIGDLIKMATSPKSVDGPQPPRIPPIPPSIPPTNTKEGPPAINKTEQIIPPKPPTSPLPPTTPPKS